MPKAWIASAGVNRWKNPVAANESSISRGKALYEQECLVCHGPAGKGDGRKAKMLNVSPADLSDPKMWQETDGALCWKISEGKTPMPTFRMRFSRREVWHLVNYIRTMAPRASGASLETQPPANQAPRNSEKREGERDQPGAANSGDAPRKLQEEEADKPESELPLAKAQAKTATADRIIWRSLRPEYLHILINPLPVYGLGTAVLVLTTGFVLRNRSMRRLGLVLIVLMAASAWPAYLIGEKAYHRVYTLADGDGQTWLDAHKHRAERLIYLFYGLAAAALAAALTPARAPKTSLTLATLTLVMALSSLGAAGWIAKAGGQVRHSEFRYQPDAARGQAGSE
jgi:mono/diheme cytochrome c family protein